MSLISELYTALIELYSKQEELEELKVEYNNYKTIIESSCSNKKVRMIQEHISWYNKDDLNKKAKEVRDQEWLDYHVEQARRREERRREERREEEKKKRAAERKALDELMEKERKERARKNQEDN